MHKYKVFNSLIPIQAPSDRPLSEYSVLQPVVESDAKYALMDNSNVRKSSLISVYCVHIYMLIIIL